MEKPKRVKSSINNPAVESYNQACAYWETYHNALLAEKDKEIAKLSNSAQFRRVELQQAELTRLKSASEMFQAEITRLKASRLTVLEIENIIEHTSSFAPINVLAQSIHKAQSEKDGGE